MSGGGASRPRYSLLTHQMDGRTACDFTFFVAHKRGIESLFFFMKIVFLVWLPWQHRSPIDF